jgi:septal ring factor EnvC (AmiA/AmiB activator)
MTLRSTWTLMIDALPSDPGKDGVAATRHLQTRLIVGAVAALAIVAGAFVWRIAASRPPPAIPTAITNAAPPARNPVLDKLVETTQGLEDSQQQAIDQLQVLQQLLASQQAEIRKSSDEIAALSDKLEALRQSFASAPPAAPAAEADAPERGKSTPPATHSQRKAHRFLAAKPRAAATLH